MVVVGPSVAAGGVAALQVESLGWRSSCQPARDLSDPPTDVTVPPFQVCTVLFAHTTMLIQRCRGGRYNEGASVLNTFSEEKIYIHISGIFFGTMRPLSYY